MQSKRHRMLAVVVVPLILLSAAVAWLPVPHFTICEGVTWAPEEARLYAAVDGFVRKVLAPSGTQVQAGTPLLSCDDPELGTQVAILEARLKEFQSRYLLHQFTDRTEAEIIKEEMMQIEAEVARARERAEDLLVKSRYRGVFVLPQEKDWPGRFVRRGTPIGFVLDQEKMRLRVLVPQADIERVQAQTLDIEVRLSEQIHAVRSARIVRQVPAATRELPSLALSLEGGGRFALDPKGQNKLQVFERLFQIDLVLDTTPPAKIDERVYVRFAHPPEPLIYRWYRSIRRLLLSRFDV